MTLAASGADTDGDAEDKAAVDLGNIAFVLWCIVYITATAESIPLRQPQLQAVRLMTLRTTTR